MAFINQGALESRRRAFERSMQDIVGGFKSIADDARAEEKKESERLRSDRKTLGDILKTTAISGYTPQEIADFQGVDLDQLRGARARAFEVAPDPKDPTLGSPEMVAPAAEPIEAPQPTRLLAPAAQAPEVAPPTGLLGDISQRQSPKFLQAQEDKKQTRLLRNLNINERLDQLDQRSKPFEETREAEKIKFQEKNKKPTDSQGKAGTFAVRMEEAEKTFSELDQLQFTTVGSFLEREAMPEFKKSEELKLQEQAERNFVNAVLRRESGAAIAPHEFRSAEKQYFPRAGDTAKVLEQKRRNRIAATTSMKAEAGNFYQKARDKFEETIRETKSKIPKPGDIIKGYKFKGGDPSKKENWEKAK